MVSSSDDLVMPSGARIAAYDNLLSAPRIVDIPSLPIQEFMELLASKTYELSRSFGGDIPYTVIREVTENFIHADFEEPVISILDQGNTITFADQGPGIEDKDKAQLPGFTSASHDMKRYIRGVGSGLPIVKEYLSISGGQLKVEDNLKNGTIVTISLVSKEDDTYLAPSVPQKTLKKPSSSDLQTRISNREDMILRLFFEYDEIGQTDIKNLLGISVGTSTRTLESLEKAGYLISNSSRKRVLTQEGANYLKRMYGSERYDVPSSENSQKG